MRQYNTILRLLIRNMLRPGGDKKRSGYVIGAYVGIWLVLAVFVFVLFRRAKHTSQDVEALKEALDARKN